MARDHDSASSDRKSEKGGTYRRGYNPEHLRRNMRIIYYSRTFLSVIGGVIAGISGFRGLSGFVFYFLVMSITSLGFVAKARFSTHSYFDCWERVLLTGLMGGLMSFVLFWTFAYDVVHIF